MKRLSEFFMTEVRKRSRQNTFLRMKVSRKKAADIAEAGDIITIGGLKDIQIGETLSSPENPVALPSIHVQQPTVRMTFGVNTSPFAGREGKWSTSRKLLERLKEELRHNISLRVEETDQKRRLFWFLVAENCILGSLLRLCGGRAMNFRLADRKQLLSRMKMAKSSSLLKRFTSMLTAITSEQLLKCLGNVAVK